MKPNWCARRTVEFVTTSPSPLLIDEIAQALGLPTQVALRHLGPARKVGEVAVVCDGKTTRWASAAVAAPLQAVISEATRKRRAEATRLRNKLKYVPVVSDPNEGKPVRRIVTEWPTERPAGPNSVFSRANRFVRTK